MRARSHLRVHVLWSDCFLSQWTLCHSSLVGLAKGFMLRCIIRRDSCHVIGFIVGHCWVMSAECEALSPEARGVVFCSPALSQVTKVVGLWDWALSKRPYRDRSKMAQGQNSRNIRALSLWNFQQLCRPLGGCWRNGVISTQTLNPK